MLFKRALHLRVIETPDFSNLANNNLYRLKELFTLGWLKQFENKKTFHRYSCEV